MFLKIFLNFKVKLLFFLSPFILFFISNNTVFAYKDNEIYERTIRGTEIIHVLLDKNADNNDVLNYIKNNFNSSFDNNVSKTPSYNKERNSSLHWFIKDNDDDLLAVYFDGGARNGRDENYDFIDLRWLGNGSPHMYCFWKTPEVDLLQHNDIIKTQHFINTNPLFDYVDNFLDKRKCTQNKPLTIKKIMKKIAEKVSGKAIKDLSAGNFLITGASGVASEKLVNYVGDILEKNPYALEAASKVIGGIEDIMMGCVDIVDDVPVVRNLAQAVLEFGKTCSKAKSYPVNICNEVGKSISQQDYKQIETPLDLAENLGKGAIGVAEGTVKATVNTVKDIGYGIGDTFIKLVKFW
jgi:hypothetical protein